jgi:hypothetical protein
MMQIPFLILCIERACMPIYDNWREFGLRNIPTVRGQFEPNNTSGENSLAAVDLH